LIDLHLHTTASDGLLEPSALVTRAAECGLRTISVTDHDTCAGLVEANDAARRLGLRLIAGVEITAVEEGRDLHMLAYFVNPESTALREFLQSQRVQRIERVRQIGDRLAALGYVVDIEALTAERGRSIGRPQVADALVRAGHACDRDDVFARLLGVGRPAFVARRGPAPEAVLAVVREAGGLVSMAHPGLTAMDHLVPRLAAAGLQALEVCHSDHDRETEDHYRQLAAEHGLAVSGGSDYHGDIGHRAALLGRVTLPAEDLAALEARRP
jgi:Predicted metal-dependent phosphoesterases (PHP family)